MLVLHKPLVAIIKGGMVQVVVGVLGCPNLPQQPIQEEDGAAGIAEKVGTEGIGCLFTAVRGQGAFVQPLNGKHPPVSVDCSLCCSASVKGAL